MAGNSISSWISGRNIFACQRASRWLSVVYDDEYFLWMANVERGLSMAFSSANGIFTSCYRCLFNAEEKKYSKK